MNHEILIETEVDGAEPYAGLLRRVIPAALEAEGVSFPCEVDVLFTDDAGIHAINLEQRGVDRPTDVLSFPMFQLTPGAPPTLDDVEADPGTGLVPLGDMVLSLERAEAQGAEYGHGAEREAAYLAVHSVLHLLGYDHLDEGPMKAQMREREEAILDAGGGGAISLLACGLLCMALGALAGGDVAGLVACGVIFALPGVVFGCAYGLYEALKGRDDPDA